MTGEELRTKLYEKMLDEQIQYRSWLLGQPGITILANATQYAVREDIVMEMSALELPEAQARALLKSKTPLADVYKEWNKTETEEDGHGSKVQWRSELGADDVTHINFAPE